MQSGLARAWRRRRRRRRRQQQSDDRLSVALASRACSQLTSPDSGISRRRRDGQRRARATASAFPRVSCALSYFTSDFISPVASSSSECRDDIDIDGEGGGRSPFWPPVLAAAAEIKSDQPSENCEGRAKRRIGVRSAGEKRFIRSASVSRSPSASKQQKEQRRRRLGHRWGEMKERREEDWAKVGVVWYPVRPSVRPSPWIAQISPEDHECDSSVL